MSAAFSRLILRPAWSRLRRNLGLDGLAALLLLTIGLTAFAAGISTVTTPLEDYSGLAFGFSLLGVLAAWPRGAAGRSPAHLSVPALVGVGLIFILIAGIGEETANLVWETSQYAAGFVRSRLVEIDLPDPGGLQLAWLQFSAPTGLFMDTLQAWIADALQRRSSPHTQAAAFFWGSGLWINTLYAGYIQRRTSNEVLAFLPAGAVLSGVFAFAGTTQTDSLVVLILAVLLLAALRTQVENENRWENRTIDYPEDIRLDFTIAAAALTLLIVVLAYVLPRVNFGETIRGFLDTRTGIPIGDAQAPRPVGEILGIQQPTPTPEFFEAFQGGDLPRSHLLGAAPDLAEIPVLEVRVFGSTNGGGEHVYWRGLSFPIYTGAGWTTGSVDTRRYGAGDAAPIETLELTRPLRQEVRVLSPQGLIAFAAGTIRTLDAPFTIAWHGDPSLAPDPFAVRRTGETYLAESRLPLLLEGRLRTAGSAYPAWVSERYLGLPETVPQRVIDLAEELAVNDNVYDNALAIEGYLRQFDYTLDLGPPPAGVDLPARLAAGYTSGEYDSEGERYLVSALNAHSWPEIYFPGFGWVPFEPTSGISEIRRDAGFNVPEVPPLPDLDFETPATSLDVLVRVAAVIAGSIVLFVLIRFWWEASRVRRMRAPDVYTAAFQWLFKNGDRLASDLPPHPTPLEFSSALEDGLQRIAVERSSLARIVPSSAGLDVLTRGYLQTQYAAVPPGEENIEQITRTWWRLRLSIAWIRILGSGIRQQ
jgi:transglutaminase-like putative cysteine protease